MEKDLAAVGLKNKNLPFTAQVLKKVTNHRSYSHQLSVRLYRNTATTASFCNPTFSLSVVSHFYPE
jgi:hypothetical protein